MKGIRLISSHCYIILYRMCEHSLLSNRMRFGIRGQTMALIFEVDIVFQLSAISPLRDYVVSNCGRGLSHH